MLKIKINCNCSTFYTCLPAQSQVQITKNSVILAIFENYENNGISKIPLFIENFGGKRVKSLDK